MRGRFALAPPAAAVGALWLVNGLTTSSIATRYPEIAESLGLDEGALGLALLGQTIGMVLVVYLLAPRLVERFGARPVAGVSGVLYCASFLLPGLAPNLAVLFLTLFVVGVANAPFDVTMGDLGGAVEERRGKPTMSAFELMFTVGMVAGTAVGSQMTGRVSVQTHLTWVGLGCVALVLVASSRFPRPLAAEPEKQGPAGRFGYTRVTLWLAVIGLGALWCEAAVVDWGGLLYKDELGAESGQYTYGLLAFVAALLVAQLLGNRLTAAFGPVAMTAAGGALFVVGIGLATTASSIGVANAGLALAGLGLANAHPLALSAAHRVGGAAAIARVNGLSYVGLVAAKPAIGGIADATSLRWAIGASALFGIAIVLGARQVKHAG